MKKLRTRSGEKTCDIEINMPGKTRKPSIEEKLKKNIEFLDALLADLQATSQSGRPGVSAGSPTESRGRQTNGRDSPDIPPPLPPPPPFEAFDPHGANPKDDLMFPPPASSSSLGQNLSELDSLLENLSNPLQYPDPPGKLYKLIHLLFIFLKGKNWSREIFHWFHSRVYNVWNIRGQI